MKSESVVCSVVSHSLHMWSGGRGGQGSLACCSPWGCKAWHSWATAQQCLWHSAFIFNWIVVGMQCYVSFRCITVIQHLNTLWKDHHSKSGNHLSSFRVTIVYWPDFLCCTLHAVTFFFLMTGSLFLLIPFIEYF